MPSQRPVSSDCAKASTPLRSRRHEVLSNPKRSDHLRDGQSFLMEAAGVEPASANGFYRASTCVASLSVSLGAASEQPTPKLAT